MSEFRKDRFKREGKGEPSSFYGRYRHTGMSMGPIELSFPAPINDSYASPLSYEELLKVKRPIRKD